MYDPVIVYKDRTNTLRISLGYDVSSDDLTSQIRAEPDEDSPIIASWVVTYLTDGTDGELILTIDDSIAANITHSTGLMDMKRVTGGEPVNVFDEPLQVTFRGVVTQ